MLEPPLLLEPLPLLEPPLMRFYTAPPKFDFALLNISSQKQKRPRAVGFAGRV
jgi:hypothetical protein